MTTEIAVARIDRTGALIRLHDGNRGLLAQTGVTESVAVVDPDTGRLTEVNGADYTTMVAASQSLTRIGTALINNRAQREMLLTAALKIPGAVDYLKQLGVYDGDSDSQYIDPNTLHANDEGLPEREVKVLSAQEMADLKKADDAEKPSKSQTRRRKAQTKSADIDAELADL